MVAGFLWVLTPVARSPCQRGETEAKRNRREPMARDRVVPVVPFGLPGRRQLLVVVSRSSWGVSQTRERLRICHARTAILDPLPLGISCAGTVKKSTAKITPDDIGGT